MGYIGLHAGEINLQGENINTITNQKSNKCHIYIWHLLEIYIYIYIYIYIQGVPGGRDKTSGEYSLC